MAGTRTISRRTGAALGTLSILLFAAVASGQGLSASAALDKNRVFLGESVRLEITVNGSNAPTDPDFSGLADFNVEKIGSRQNNQTSIYFDGSQTVRQVTISHILQYNLIPKRTGTLTIPALTLTADGNTVSTAAINLTVQEPVQNEDFQLTMYTSTSECYVGEPVALYLRLLFSKSIERAQLLVPVIADRNFTCADPPLPAGSDVINVPATGGVMSGTRTAGRLKGAEVPQILFQKILIPRNAGTFPIPMAVFDGHVLTGYRDTADPFGFFSNRRAGVYERFQVPSKNLSLKVLPLPPDGRPQDFNGPVCRNINISATANPTVVNIGDPITLTITLSGTPYIQHVALPPLGEQPALANSFKIPRETEDGTASGAEKVYVVTVRATTADITSIPSIELPYFNSSTRSYDVARSKPIPIEVRQTKIVRVTDAEGNDGGVAGAALTEWSKGIAHNYEDGSVLAPREYGLKSLFHTPAWTCAVSCPPLVFLIALIIAIIRNVYFSDPIAMRARRAYPAFRRSLAAIRKTDKPGAVAPALLDCLREYLSARLRINTASMTIDEFESALRERGVPEDAMVELKAVFERCEAGSYAGVSVTGDLPSETARTIEKLEKLLS